MKKIYYEKPECEILVVQNEGCLCTSDPWGDEGKAGKELKNGGSFDFDE